MQSYYGICSYSIMLYAHIYLHMLYAHIQLLLHIILLASSVSNVTIYQNCTIHDVTWNYDSTVFKPVIHTWEE
jgi:cellulose synthase/poly-beta-1,6-N-acetylglucosamine synthase-like glycosyltransferase